MWGVLVGVGLVVQRKAFQLAAQSTVLYLLSILSHTRARGTSKSEMSSGICHEQTTFLVLYQEGPWEGHCWRRSEPGLYLRDSYTLYSRSGVVLFPQ